jgi:glycosyltransferase involved in cell wall biosynthesis
MADTQSARVDISVVITAHREGIIVGQSVRSAQEAIAHAQAEGMTCEIVGVLDRADDVTAANMRSALGANARIIATNEGDPGQARNRGVAESLGQTVAFLDGDDLWSRNWLSAAFRQSVARPDAIAHSACNLVFGRNRLLWWHTDSETALCDTTYLNWANYWDAMTLAPANVYRRFPFRANDLGIGFGHEDWHWNMLTLKHGFAHKPVPGTMHFKRSRPGSQMSLVERVGNITWPIGKDE